MLVELAFEVMLGWQRHIQFVLSCVGKKRWEGLDVGVLVLGSLAPWLFQLIWGEISLCGVGCKRLGRGLYYGFCVGEEQKVKVRCLIKILKESRE